MNATKSRGDKYAMAGTEGTYEYTVTASNGFAKIGYRVLSNGRVRVRIEPRSKRAADLIAKRLTWLAGWKQPGEGGQNRFSIVLYDTARANKVIRTWTVIVKFYGVSLIWADVVKSVRARLRRHA